MALAKFAFVLLIAVFVDNRALAQMPQCSKEELMKCAEIVKKQSTRDDHAVLCPVMKTAHSCMNNVTLTCQDGHPVKIGTELFMEKINMILELCENPNLPLGENMYCNWEKVSECVAQMKEDFGKEMDEPTKCRVWWKTKYCLHTTWYKCDMGQMQRYINRTYEMLAYKSRHCEALTCNKRFVKNCMYMATNSMNPKYQQCQDTVHAKRCVKGMMDANCQDYVVRNYVKENLFPKLRNMLDECVTRGYIDDYGGEGYDAGANLKPTTFSLMAAILTAVAAGATRF